MVFQFKTHHNPDSFETLPELLETFSKYGLEVVSQITDPKWEETTIILEGSEENFRAMFTETSEGEPGTDISEFMDELIPV